MLYSQVLLWMEPDSYVFLGLEHSFLGILWSLTGWVWQFFSEPSYPSSLQSPTRITLEPTNCGAWEATDLWLAFFSLDDIIIVA